MIDFLALTNLGMVIALAAIGTFGGIKTLVVDDRTILVVVMGESLKLLLRLVRGGFEPFEFEPFSSEAGKLAAFLKDVIQLLRIPSVMAEKTVLLPSNVCTVNPKFRGSSVFSTCCTKERSMMPSMKPLLSAFGSR